MSKNDNLKTGAQITNPDKLKQDFFPAPTP